MVFLLSRGRIIVMFRFFASGVTAAPMASISGLSGRQYIVHLQSGGKESVVSLRFQNENNGFSGVSSGYCDANSLLGTREKGHEFHRKILDPFDTHYFGCGQAWACGGTLVLAWKPVKGFSNVHSSSTWIYL
jgi:hypothetical protein